MWAWRSGIEREATVGRIVEIPALAIMTSREVIRCWVLRVLRAVRAEVGDALSRVTVMRQDVVCLGSVERESAVGWWGERTVAMTVVLGRRRYVETRPRPRPVVGGGVSGI